MKKQLRKIWKGIKKIWKSLRGATKEVVPIAIKIVEGLKKVTDSPVDDVILSIITSAIPGDADDILVEKVKKFVQKELPHVLVQLKVINSIAGIDDPNEQLKAILAEFNLSSDEFKNATYHTLSSMIIEALSDGKLKWSEAVVLSEFYYKNILNK